MKPIPDTFHAFGFTYHQVERAGKFAIYRLSLPGRRDVAHEVVEVQSHSGFQIGGNDPVEAAEYYPSPELWGKSGWTFTTFDQAHKKFNQLLGIPEKKRCAVKKKQVTSTSK